MRKVHLIGAVVGVLALVTATVAVASNQFTQTANVKLTKKKAGKSTGISVALRSTDPGEPGGKPKAASKIVIKLPKGSAINTKATAQCNLGEEDVKAGKCPAKSLIGKGTAKANAAPLFSSTTEDVKAYTRKGGIVLLLTDNASDPQPGQTIVLQASVTKKGVISVTVPELQPVPNLFVVLTDFTLKTSPKSKGKGKNKVNLITTPKTCKKSKGWVSTTTFTYADGSAKDVIKTKQACSK